jgi:hypothetical protein
MLLGHEALIEDVVVVIWSILIQLTGCPRTRGIHIVLFSFKIASTGHVQLSNRLQLALAAFQIIS